MTHTHTRKPEAVRAWQHEEGATLPEWAIDGGIHPEDLEREIDGETVHPIPVGNWLVQIERKGMIRNMTSEQFEAEYDAL